MKKLVSLFLAVCMCCTMGVMLVSCNLFSNNDGTYYLYEDGVTDKTSWVKINGSNWSDSDGMSGRFELEDKTISFYVTYEGKEELLLDGTLEDGKLTIGGGIVTVVYYLDGKAPQSDEAAGGNGSQGKLEFTLQEDSDTYALTGLGSFQGTRLEIPAEHNGKAVTAILGDWNGGNSTIKEIIIPDSVTYIGMRTAGLSGMFQGFSALEYIEFGDGIETIPKKVCYGIKTLKTIVFGANVKVIDEEAFDRTGIVTLTIPEGVTTIAYSAFHQCEKLEQVSLPSTVKVLGASAFQTCTSLKTVVFAGTEDQFFLYVSKEANTFARCHEELKIVYTEN